MKNRIVYVDCIKGLSIMIVVLIHVFESSICINSVSGEGGTWYSLTHAFIMPLFAFMSGLFIHGFYNLIDVRSKFERLMIPMLTLGVAYAYMKGHSFVEYAMHDFKYGYWYLLFLFESIIIISFVELISKIFTIKYKKYIVLPIYILIFALVVALVSIAPKYLGLCQIRHVFPYLLCGYLLKQYGYYDKCFNKKLLFEFACLIFVISFSLLFLFQYDVFIHLVRPSAIFIIVYLFHEHYTSNKINNILNYWGKLSLEIYVLHFFILSNIKINIVSSFLNNSSLLYLLFALVLAIFTCELCAIISKLIKTSALFKFLFFGER